MRDKYTDSIRIGIVSSIDPEKGTAKITFKDRDDIVSRELPVVVPCTLEDKWYYMPDIGERVRVLFDPEAPTRGCILGSYYDDVRKPPEHDGSNIQYALFKDETLVKYDRRLHKLTIKIPQDGGISIDVFAKSDIHVETGQNLNVTVAENTTITTGENTTIVTGDNTSITTGADTNIETAGETNITSGGDVNITAANINLN